MGAVDSSLEAIYNFMCLGPLVLLLSGVTLPPALHTPYFCGKCILPWLLALGQGRPIKLGQIGPLWEVPNLTLEKKALFS